MFLVHQISSRKSSYKDPLLECHADSTNIEMGFSENLKSLIMLKSYNTIMSTHHVAELLLGKSLADSKRIRLTLL